jgi:hypothetical protein
MCIWLYIIIYIYIIVYNYTYIYICIIIYINIVTPGWCLFAWHQTIGWMLEARQVIPPEAINQYTLAAGGGLPCGDCWEWWWETFHPTFLLCISVWLTSFESWAPSNFFLLSWMDYFGHLVVIWSLLRKHQLFFTNLNAYNALHPLYSNNCSLATHLVSQSAIQEISIR